MKTRLIEMEIMGMKNIEKSLTFQFLGETINRSKPISIVNSNMKAIYGPNGSGKTAIIHAVDVYRSLTTKYGYLVDDENKKQLSNLINKKINKFGIVMWYEITDDNDHVSHVYSHDLRVAIDGSDVIVEKEEIREYTQNSIHGDSETIVKIENGMIKQVIEEKSELGKLIYDSMNTVSGISSIISLFTNAAFLNNVMNHLKRKDISHTEVGSLTESLINTFTFVFNLDVYLADSDKHKVLTQGKLLDILAKTSEENAEGVFADRLIVNEEIIPKKAFDKYSKQVETLTSFIRIFKPELKTIAIKKRIDGSDVHVSKEFVYDKYRIDEQYESTGIRKLVELFTYLNKASNGCIIFIDELDANINDVYLNAFISYFVKYAQGQLVFTTHNTSSMTTMKKLKHGIDFIANDNTLSSWTNNGHASPSARYKGGMIKGIPFNVNDFDFIECFGGDVE